MVFGHFIFYFFFENLNESLGVTLTKRSQVWASENSLLKCWVSLAAYNRTLWSGPFSDPEHSGRLVHRAALIKAFKVPFSKHPPDTLRNNVPPATSYFVLSMLMPTMHGLRLSIVSKTSSGHNPRETVHFKGSSWLPNLFPGLWLKLLFFLRQNSIARFNRELHRPRVNTGYFVHRAALFSATASFPKQFIYSS